MRGLVSATQTSFREEPSGTDIRISFPISSAQLLSFLASLLDCYFDETHAAKKTQHDRGREIGNRIAALFRRASNCHGRSLEKASLLHHDDVGYGATESQQPRFGESDEDEPSPIYRSQESSPKLSPKSFPESPGNVDVQPVAAKEMKIFTKPVIMNIMSYGILAL